MALPMNMRASTILAGEPSKRETTALSMKDTLPFVVKVISHAVSWHTYIYKL